MSQSFTISTFFDPGTAHPQEDAFVSATPFFAVLDGVSGVYDGDLGPALYDGVSGGRKVTDIISQSISTASPYASVSEIADRSDEEIRSFLLAQHLDLAQSELLPGAQIALAKVTNDSVEILTCGDAFALWEKSDGTFGGTENRNYAHEKTQGAVAELIFTKHAGDRKAGWKEYLPVAAAFKRERTNKKGIANAYGLLNGQKEASAFYQTLALPRASLRHLLLFTDGFVTLEETAIPEKMAETVIGAYKKGGWQNVLATHLSAGAKARHVEQGEATGLALDFFS